MNWILKDKYKDLQNIQLDIKLPETKYRLQY